MTLSLTGAQPAVSGLLSKEMVIVNGALQAALDGGDNVRALALNGLRSKCTFDQMRVNAAAIAAVDSDPATLELLDALEQACGQLDDILNRSQDTNAWMKDVADASDKVFSALGKLVHY